MGQQSTGDWMEFQHDELLQILRVERLREAERERLGLRVQRARRLTRRAERAEQRAAGAARRARLAVAESAMQ
jgi:hypothetical protein